MSKFNPSKVNEIVFEEIKADLNKAYSDSYIREVYNIGETTLRLVKHSSSFAAYKKYHTDRLAYRKAKAEAKRIAKDYPIDERIIRRLIRVQVQKTQPSVLYDLDYDLQLQEAIKIVQRKDYSTLLKNTKTLKQLQEEAEAAQ